MDAVREAGRTIADLQVAGDAKHKQMLEASRVRAGRFLRPRTTREAIAGCMALRWCRAHRHLYQSVGSPGCGAGRAAFPPQWSRDAHSQPMVQSSQGRSITPSRSTSSRSRCCKKQLLLAERDGVLRQHQKLRRVGREPATWGAARPPRRYTRVAHDTHGACHLPSAGGGRHAREVRRR